MFETRDVEHTCVIRDVAVAVEAIF